MLEQGKTTLKMTRINGYKNLWFFHAIKFEEVAFNKLLMLSLIFFLAEYAIHQF